MLAQSLKGDLAESNKRLTALVENSSLAAVVGSNRNESTAFIDKVCIDLGICLFSFDCIADHTQMSLSVQVLVWLLISSHFVNVLNCTMYELSVSVVFCRFFLCRRWRRQSIQQ